MITNLIPAGTRVRILGFTMQGERDWSETGHVLRWHKESGPRENVPGYHRIRFDADKAILLVHRERLMVCNDQAA